MFLTIGGTYVDLIEGGTNLGRTNVGRTNVGGRKVASSQECTFKDFVPLGQTLDWNHVSIFLKYLYLNDKKNCKLCSLIIWNGIWVLPNYF